MYKILATIPLFALEQAVKEALVATVTDRIFPMAAFGVFSLGKTTANMHCPPESSNKFCPGVKKSNDNNSLPFLSLSSDRFQLYSTSKH